MDRDTAGVVVEGSCRACSAGSAERSRVTGSTTSFPAAITVEATMKARPRVTKATPVTPALIGPAAETPVVATGAAEEAVETGEAEEGATMAEAGNRLERTQINQAGRHGIDHAALLV